MYSVPIVQLHQMLHFLFHVFLQLSWPQYSVTDRTHGRLSVIQALHFTWRDRCFININLQ